MFSYRPESSVAISLNAAAHSIVLSVVNVLHGMFNVSYVSVNWKLSTLQYENNDGY